VEPGQGLEPAGPTLTLGLTEGHLVNTTTRRRPAALLVTLLAAALATVALAAPAQAAAYRYWSYWQGDSGTWVAAQTGPWSLEVIVVDDGSTDDTKAVVEAWRSNHPQPLSYLYQDNAGKHAAHNNAVAHAQGFMFITLDSDDSLLPGALALVITFRLLALLRVYPWLPEKFYQVQNRKFTYIL